MAARNLVHTVHFQADEYTVLVRYWEELDHVRIRTTGTEMSKAQLLHLHVLAGWFEADKKDWPGRLP